MSRPLSVFALLFGLWMVWLSGCTIGGYTIARQADLDTQIARARTEATLQMETLKTKELGLLKQVIAEHEARLQSAADHLFKGVVVFGSLREDQKNRPMMVIGQSVQLTALDLPAARPEAQAAALQALQTELDEAKTTTAALKAQYDAELAKARADAAAKVAKMVDLEKQLDQVATEKVTVLEKAAEKERALQAAKDREQDKDLAMAEKEAADAEDNQKAKMWLMGVLLAAAAACGLGAAFLPIPQLKGNLIIGAAICGGAALAIPFIKPWMVFVGLVAALLPVIALAVKAYHKEHKVATSTYRAIQTVKETAPEAFEAAVKPALEEWHTKYTKDGGKTPDIQASSHIDARLRETDSL